MTAQPDYWASTDHDPTSHTETARHLATITTAHALVLARADIHDALAADSTTSRRSCAHSASTHATTVLGAADATPDQRRIAHYYLVDAHVLLAIP